MILRKPYAFFIKNFRLMHLIMTILLGYLAFETYNLLGFINGYLNDSIKYVNQVWTSTYFNNWMFIFPLIIIAMAIMIMSVLIRKKKPARFYLINISSMIFSLIYYVLVYNSMVKIETQIVDVRVMRAYKDFSIALLAIQLIAAFITFARASGFDVKKFDFGKDLKELNLQESDREEVEIEINIDTDKVKRKRNKIFRYAKYYYLENKEVYNGIFITIGIIIVISFLLDKYVYNKTYLYDNYFTASYFTMRIDDAYLVNEDYYGNKIVKEGNTLVVIKMQIKTTGKDVKQELPTAKTAVLANGKRYYPVTTYRDKLADLGITYEGQTITNTYNYYLLTYEIPNSELKNLEFNFFIGYNIGKSVEPNIVHVNLGYNDVNGTKNTSTNYLTDIVSLKDSLVDDINIKINSYELKEVFENDYYSCYKSVCIASKEYIRANYDTNYDKVLLKLNINYGVNEDKDKLKTFTELINYYGKLEYKVGDQTYYQNGNLVFITPKYNLDKNTYYIEINKDAMKADSLVLVLDIRNMNYRFKLR